MQQPHRDENVSPRAPIGLQLTTHTTGQAAVGPKLSLYTGTSEELPLYTQVT